MGWEFVDRILTHGNDICLLLNPSVNAYRRLDPHFEAPNQIKASAVDRGSMIRIPIGNERSMRVEVRSVAPDANPYLVMLSIFKSGLEGDTAKIKNLRQAERYRWWCRIHRLVVLTGALGALGKVVAEAALSRGARVAGIDHAALPVRA